LLPVPCTCPCALLVVSCYPRDLHSFPTRRSSDLFGTLGMAGIPGSCPPSPPSPPSPPNPAGILPNSPEPISPLSRLESWRRLKPDRKSTRLNSSHQIISYAVFCLKKKKHEA